MVTGARIITFQSLTVTVSRSLAMMIACPVNSHVVSTVTAFRVGQASRPGHRENYYNGEHARAQPGLTTLMMIGCGHLLWAQLARRRANVHI